MRSLARGWPSTSAVAALGLRRVRRGILVAMKYDGIGASEINRHRTRIDGAFAPLPCRARGARFS